MVILYALWITYILSINFYAFMLVKNFRHQEEQGPTQQKYLGKLLITGALGGAITIFVAMLIFKWRTSELVLMVLLPLFAVINIYLWVVLFRSGIRFFVIP